MRDDPPFGRSEETRPVYQERPREAPGLGIAVGVVVAVVALLALAFWLRREQRPARPFDDAPAPLLEAASDAATAAPAAATPRPPLDQSDAWLRELAATLSSHPQLAAWLIGDDLARRLVATVINLAEGTSPAGHLGDLRPADGFRASRSAGRWFVDAASFRRYDLLADVVASLDPAAAARLLGEIRPLLDQAYGEIGDPASDFDRTLARAVGNLLAVPIPDGEPELVRQGALWAYADRELEQRTAAEKHLLRLGPDNARRVQAKLRELAAAAGLAPP